MAEAGETQAALERLRDHDYPTHLPNTCERHHQADLALVAATLARETAHCDHWRKLCAEIGATLAAAQGRVAELEAKLADGRTQCADCGGSRGGVEAWIRRAEQAEGRIAELENEPTPEWATRALNRAEKAEAELLISGIAGLGRAIIERCAQVAADHEADDIATEIRALHPEARPAGAP